MLNEITKKKDKMISQQLKNSSQLTMPRKLKQALSKHIYSVEDE
jgi:hypothetical protein